MVRCTACDNTYNSGDYTSLAKHFIGEAKKNDTDHISWLNRNLSKEKLSVDELALLFKELFNIEGNSLNKWVKERFIEKFYREPAHPFVERLQHPSKATLLGYVLEHQHFLRQWVRSCSYIIAKTDYEDVTKYELDNIYTEYGGSAHQDVIPHYELLIRMGESLGLTRKDILETKPLPDTQKAIDTWNHIANSYHWVETMLAMHGLELIANKNMRKEGASKHYFDPEILETNEINTASKDFLREGYQADVYHAEEALKLVEKYAIELKIVDNVQATFLKSIDMFDKYLMSRVQRARQLETE